MAHTIEVKAQQDFWKRFVGSQPSRAIAEIVWNSFDADADTIEIEAVTDELGTVTKLYIRDNGEGIPYAKDKHLFSQLGNSWKARAGRSRIKKRILQGKNGEGRFRALSLGGYVSWTTVYEEGGKNYKYNIDANSDKIGSFYISDMPEISPQSTGTSVEISNLYKSTESYLNKVIIDDLAYIFASYINKYRDVKVVFNNVEVKIGDLVSRSESFGIGPINLTNGKVVTADLEVIEWRNLNHRAMYLCDENGFTFAERAPEVRAPGYNFCAYLKSSYFSELSAGSLMDVDMEEGIAKLVSQGRDVLSEYFRRMERQKARNLIEEWKKDKVYPYREDELGEVVNQSRRIFNMCAVTIHTQAKGFSTQDRISKALSFRLLREAIEERPSEVSKILTEVLNLSREKQKQFATLLDNSRLSDIIDTVSLVRHRIGTAKGLRALVCSDETKHSVKERQHIHQICERNPWLFGEEFALGVTESSLTNALREHLRRLRITDSVLAPVLQAGGKNARVDLMLCQSVKLNGRDDDHHLVIELKRAKKSLGMPEFEQIMNYSTAIMNDSRYKKTNVRWSFWLVGVDITPQLDSIVTSSDRPPGCAHIFKEGNGKVWVKTWGQLLHDCVSRLEFVREKLDLAITEEDSVSYLNEIYPEFVPSS